MSSQAGVESREHDPGVPPPDLPVLLEKENFPSERQALLGDMERVLQAGPQWEARLEAESVRHAQGAVSHRGLKTGKEKPAVKRMKWKGAGWAVGRVQRGTVSGPIFRAMKWPGRGSGWP